MYAGEHQAIVEPTLWEQVSTSRTMVHRVAFDGEVRRTANRTYLAPWNGKVAQRRRRTEEPGARESAPESGGIDSVLAGFIVDNPFRGLQKLCRLAAIPLSRFQCVLNQILLVGLDRILKGNIHDGSG